MPVRTDTSFDATLPTDRESPQREPAKAPIRGPVERAFGLLCASVAGLIVPYAASVCGSSTAAQIRSDRRGSRS